MASRLWGLPIVVVRKLGVRGLGFRDLGFNARKLEHDYPHALKVK